MVKIEIDGITYEVTAERNLLETCLALGFDIPYFCNHPALGSVGACRLCAVKKFAGTDDKKGRIVMSCMESVTDGLRISLSDPAVKEFRAAVIEGLMTNHPHDCPVCDEGGECHLQDMTVMTGHAYRQYVFKKRTFNNQELGPFINHELNRCIQCYRCVRFYRDYAGGKDLNVFGSANHVYFGRQKDGVLESEFSGNLVEVCPTGVFTDKTLKRHYARKWDLTNAPSICIHCSIGCNIIVSERYGSVRRVMSRYNGSVNGYFICDRGRFGYEFINNPGRIKKILFRASKKEAPTEVEELSAAVIAGAREKDIIGIGSPRASLEANFALSALVGKENFFHGISGSAHKLAGKAVSILDSGIARSPSLKDMEKCDAILILGEDVTNTAPMTALALRQSARKKSVTIAAKIGIPEWNDTAVREMEQGQKYPIFIATPFTTKLDELAEQTCYFAPAEIARLGFAIASEIDHSAPGLHPPDRQLQKIAQPIAVALLAAEKPLIVTGLTLGNEDILNAAANIAAALSSAGKKASLSIIFPECNSAGLAMLGGESLDKAVERSEKSSGGTLIILENDLYRRIPEKRADALFEKFSRIIVLDHLMNETTAKADILLPAAAFAESDGTMVNNEGRAQRFYNVLQPAGPVKESWRWISDLEKMFQINPVNIPEKFDDIVEALAGSSPLLSPIKEKMPSADMRFFNEKIARQNKRYSGRTAMDANISVSEPAPPPDEDSPLKFSMEGYQGDPPSSLIPFYWSPGWNSCQAMTGYMDAPDGSLREGGDPGIRLFSEKKDGAPGYFKDVPGPFKLEPSELLIVPVCTALGSEELSSRAEAIGELIPEPFILLNEKEMSRLELNEQDKVDISIDQLVLNVNVRADSNMADGFAGLSLLATGMPQLELPAWGRVLNTELK